MPLKDDDNHLPHSDRTLPTEIVTEILLKLPVESLLRCKSVCKFGRSLISDPHFVNSHLSLSAHNNNNTRLIITFWGSNMLNTCRLDDMMNGEFINNDLEVVDYPFKSVGGTVRVVGSCNGLLCLRGRGRNDPNDSILFIWNPSTSKYRKLLSDVSLKFFGFGYDECSNDYKVVSVSVKRRNEVDALVKMYSLRNGSWKDIGAFPHGRACGSGKFVNGALHWMDLAGDYSSKIVSLDLGTETFGEVLQPVYGEGKTNLKLGTLGEWLCVLCDYNENRLDLWVMKVYGVKDSWTKLVSVSHIPDPEIGHFWTPLCISNDGKILLTYGLKLMIYDSKNKSFAEIKKFDELFYASTFVESLVSPSNPCTSHRIAASNG